MCAAWGHEYVSYSTVAEWLQRFRRGRISSKDDLRMGRPTTVVTDKNIDAVGMLIKENPHISIRHIAWEVDLSYGVVSSIIHEELKTKKLCARWIPHELREECKKLWVEICQENLDMMESGQWRLCDIITGDETWFYHRGIDSKQSNVI